MMCAVSVPSDASVCPVPCSVASGPAMRERVAEARCVASHSDRTHTSGTQTAQPVMTGTRTMAGQDATPRRHHGSRARAASSLSTRASSEAGACRNG